MEESGKILSKELEELVSEKFDIKENEIGVILIYDNKERQQIHILLEHLNIKKLSCDVPRYSSELIMRIYKCRDCNGKTPIRSNDYRYGFLPNNQDEYYSFDCDRCGRHINYEPNYDDYDNIIFVGKNNAICFGKYFKYASPRKDYDSDISILDLQKCENISKQCTTYHLEKPEKNCLSKKRLGRYVSEEIVENNLE